MNGKIILYDVFRERKVVQKIDETDVCNVVKFSSSNPYLLGAGYKSKIKIWDIRNVLFSSI
jgi:WD40 repeat protein